MYLLAPVDGYWCLKIPTAACECLLVSDSAYLCLLMSESYWGLSVATGM